jgi:hypothetical protein
MTFNNSTSDADPGAGKIAFNNGTLSSVSVLFIDDADDAGADITTFVQSFDDVTNAVARGIITVTKEATPATYATFKVTGSVTSASGYSKVAVTHLTSSGSFSNLDGVSVHFAYSGADGTGDMTSFTLAGDSGSNQTITNGNTLTIAGGEGIDTSGGATDTVTIAGEDATSSNKGIASFSGDNFSVSSGAVTIKDDGVATAEIQDNAVTAAKFNADVISGQTELAAEPADTDEFLVSDAGVLKRMDYSHIKAGAVTVSQKATTTSTGTFTISSLTANIPVFIIGGNASDKTEISYKVTSGTTSPLGLTHNTSTFFGIFSDDTQSARRAMATVLIPTGTSIVLSVNQCVGTLTAFQ